MFKQEEVSISTLKVKGLKGNFTYCEYLSLCSNVTFFCELWTKPNEVNLIKDLALKSNKNFLYKSDIDHTYKRGRPFGGQGWLLDKNYDLFEHRFINKHLSFVHLNIHGSEFVIIGVYLPFFDSKNTNESKSIFEQSLSLIISITNEFKKNIIPVLITGDFNADINRKNKFDIILKNFLIDHDYILLDELNKNNSYTFKSASIKNTYHLSNLDHFILCQSTFPLTMTKTEFRISRMWLI